MGMIKKHLTEGQPGMVVAVENLSTLTVSNGQRTFTARPQLWDPAHQTQYYMFTTPTQVELSFLNDNINDLKLAAVNYGARDLVWAASNYFPHPHWPGFPGIDAGRIPFQENGLFIDRYPCNGFTEFGQGLPREPMRCVEICDGIHAI